MDVMPRPVAPTAKPGVPFLLVLRNVSNAVLAPGLIEGALTEHIAHLLDAMIHILDAGNDCPLSANFELLQFLDRRSYLVALLALVISIVRQIVRSPDIAKRLHLANEEAVRFAPSFNELDETMLGADALMEPDRCAVAVADVPKRIDRNTVRVREQSYAPFFSSGSQLYGEVSSFCRLLKGFLRGAGILLPHLFRIAGEVAITRGDVPIALLLVQRLARLGLDLTATVGALVSFWSEVRLQEPDGSLRGWDAEDVSIAMGLSPHKIGFESALSAMKDAGFIRDEDGQLVVHE